MNKEIISQDYENYLMKVWNNLVSYFEDFEIDMDQEDKLRFAQGYLFGLKVNNYIREKDYIIYINQISKIILKECE